MKYVSDKIVAKNKVLWIHNDFSTTNYKINYLQSEVEQYNKVYAVSQILKDEFCERIPKLADKTEVKYNSVDIKGIMLKSLENINMDDYDSECKVLSVGRLCDQKGFDMAIKVASMLKLEGYKFCWYIVGEGEDRESLQKQILSYNVTECFKLLGAKSNPYPYFAGCDIYCQPSRHEGYCTTTVEAKLFNLPILTTKVSGAEEQFIDGVNGIITEISVDSIYAGMVKLMDVNYRNKLTKVNIEIEN